MRHIKKSDMVRTVCSSILRHILEHSANSARLKHNEGDKGMLRHIQALLRNTEQYSDIFRTLCYLCIYKLVIFRTLTHLEFQASSKAGRTRKMIMQILNPGIVRKVSSKHFKYIYGYSGIMIYIQPHPQAHNQGEGKDLPCLF